MSPVPYDVTFVEALLASYARLLSVPLLPQPLAPVQVSSAQRAAWLYEVPELAVVAHDTAADPCFVYANLAAQRCFERSWDEFVGLPSRLSAEAPERNARAEMLAQVAQHGFLRGYRGLRVAASGHRFWIEQGIIWNIQGPDGVARGQAALFPVAASLPAAPA